MVEHGEAVIAVGAGVGDDVHLHGGERAVAARPGLDAHAHGMARGGADELLLAGEFELHRLPGLENGKRDDVLDQHFLLGTEAAAHALAEHANVGRIEVEQSRQRPPRQIRRLRAGTDIEPAGRVEPADGAMGLQVRVLNPLGDVGPLVANIGLGKAFIDIADMAVQFAGDIALRIVDARFRALVRA